jgi:hypothetical protein
LGSDRGFALTVRACRQGVIDFTQARISDVRWWRRSNLLIDSMARDDDLEIIKAAYDFHLALVANPQLTEESWKSAKTNALELFNEAVNVVHPWGAKSTEQRRAEEYDRLAELYRQHIQGGKTDEEWAEIIDAEVHRLRSETNSAETELTDEQRIDKLAAERIRKQAQSRRP